LTPRLKRLRRKLAVRELLWASLIAIIASAVALPMLYLLFTGHLT